MRMPCSRQISTIALAALDAQRGAGGVLEVRDRVEQLRALAVGLDAGDDLLERVGPEAVVIDGDAVDLRQAGHHGARGCPGSIGRSTMATSPGSRKVSQTFSRPPAEPQVRTKFCGAETEALAALTSLREPLAQAGVALRAAVLQRVRALAPQDALVAGDQLIDRQRVGIGDAAGEHDRLDGRRRQLALPPRRPRGGAAARGERLLPVEGIGHGCIVATALACGQASWARRTSSWVVGRSRPSRVGRRSVYSISFSTLFCLAHDLGFVVVGGEEAAGKAICGAGGEEAAQLAGALGLLPGGVIGDVLVRRAVGLREEARERVHLPDVPDDVHRLGVHHAGRDREHDDASVLHFEREVLAEADEAGLGDAVRVEKGLRDDAGAAGDVDDAAGAALEHARQDDARAEHVADQVVVDGLADFIKVEGLERARDGARRAGVVHEQRRRAEDALRLREHRFDGGGLFDVGGDRCGAAAVGLDQRHRFGELLGRAGGDHDGGAGGGERLRDRAADAAATARDDGDLSFEYSGHGSAPLPTQVQLMA